MIKAIFKHAALYSAGQIVGKIATVGVFIYLARTLGPAAFGTFAFFLSLVQVITYFGDFGLGQSYLTKHTDKEPRAFSDMIAARGFTLIISLFAAYFIAQSASFSWEITMAFIATVLSESILTITEYHYLRIRNTFVITLRLIGRMVFLVAFVLIFNTALTIESLVWYYFAASLLTALLFVPWNMMKQCTVQSGKAIFKTLRRAGSYAALSVTSFAYSRGDSILIGYILTPASLGIYSAAYRYLESTSILPASLNKLLFPHVALNARLSWNKVTMIVTIMAALGLLVSAAIFFLAEFLVLFLVGPAFAQAVPILRIFALVILLFFINQPLAALIQSTPWVSRFLPWGIANTAVNIGLNFMLIPTYGITAAAWVMVFTEFTGLIINWYFVRKIYGS